MFLASEALAVTALVAELVLSITLHTLLLAISHILEEEAINTLGAFVLFA